MKCLSLMQPWATLIAIGSKQIETRSWKTNYRGELYIHASMRTDKKILKEKPFSQVLENIDLPNGYIIAKCQLVDCVEMTDELIKQVKEQGNEYAFGDYAVGRYAWILDNVELLEYPIEAKGRLGIWEFQENIKRDK
jgi:hypothetical protein